MKSSVTIGVLDGVHLGHRSLLRRLDDSLRRVVLTFDPHPLEVLRPGIHPRLLTTLPERTALLEGLGIDEVIALDLADIKELSPEDFVKRYLVDRLDIGQLVVGNDFRFGRDRSGDVALLEQLASNGGWEVDPIDLVIDKGAPISSSRIRGLVEEGNIVQANQLLGSEFTVTGEVVHGDKRGREIGYPTANMRPPSRKVIPGTGVYACRVMLAGEMHDAAVNVGFRPTFDGTELLIEAFIFDFSREIYGEKVAISFVERLRPELKFDSVEALVENMDQDVERARQILGLSSESNMS